MSDQFVLTPVSRLTRTVAKVHGPVTGLLGFNGMSMVSGTVCPLSAVVVRFGATSAGVGRSTTVVLVRKVWLQCAGYYASSSCVNGNWLLVNGGGNPPGRGPSA